VKPGKSETTAGPSEPEKKRGLVGKLLGIFKPKKDSGN
jgi:hypothetical protein